MRDDVPGTPALEAINADGGHATGTAFVEADSEVEFLRFSPERIIGRVPCHPIVIRIGAQEAPTHAQYLAGKAHLLDRRVDGLHRQHRYREEAIGIRRTVI